jgi:hypothetical protein
MAYHAAAAMARRGGYHHEPSPCPERCRGQCPSARVDRSRHELAVGIRATAVGRLVDPVWTPQAGVIPPAVLFTHSDVSNMSLPPMMAKCRFARARDCRPPAPLIKPPHKSERKDYRRCKPELFPARPSPMVACNHRTQRLSAVCISDHPANESLNEAACASLNENCSNL